MKALKQRSYLEKPRPRAASKYKRRFKILILRCGLYFYRRRLAWGLIWMLLTTSSLSTFRGTPTSRNKLKIESTVFHGFTKLQFGVYAAGGQSMLQSQQKMMRLSKKHEALWMEFERLTSNGRYWLGSEYDG